MAFLRPNHIAILSDRLNVAPSLDRRDLVPEFIDRLDELDAPAVIDSSESFVEACAVAAALRLIVEYRWNRREDQQPDFASIAKRWDALCRLTAPYARKHILRSAEDRHACAYLLSSAMYRHEASAWACLLRLKEIGALRRGLMPGEADERAFVVGYDAPIRSEESTSDDQGRSWPNFYAVPDLLAIPTFAYVPSQFIATLPPLDGHHTTVPLGTRVGFARHPPLSRFTHAAIHRLTLKYPVPRAAREVA
jgi:hypothetical protein